VKRHNDQHISDALSSFLSRSKKLKDGHLTFQLRARWSSEMGEAVSAMTELIEVKGDKVVIRFSSSVLKNEFYQNQAQLVQKLNEILELDNYIQSVVLF